MTVVTLYGKPGCHLCDDARRVIHDLRAERDFVLDEVDITRDAGLFRQYGERIPVVAIDGAEKFEFYVDSEGLARALDRVSP
jgi:glutaredoxin